MAYQDEIVNHARITVTSKKTGAVEVLLEDDARARDYTDPTTGKFVETGIPLTETVNDSLDTLTFIVKESPTRKLYRPFDVVDFTVNDGLKPVTYEMCILSDRATLFSRMSGLYTHTVTAIECTKLLEKVKIFNLNLTNPYDTLLRQFEKAINNAEPVLRSTREEGGQRVVNFERKCRFAISAPLRTLLDGKPGEDFYNGNTDLRAVLDNILSKLNCRVTVESIAFDAKHDISEILLGYRSMAAVQNAAPAWTFEEQGEIVGEEMENYAQDVAGTIVARGYNTVSDSALTFTDVFKSDTYNLTDLNATAFFPFPISERGIAKFAVRTSFKAKVIDFYGSSRTIDDQVVDVDITQRLIPYEQFQLLDDAAKRDYLPYEIGASYMKVGQYLKEEFVFTESNIKAIINELGPKQGTEIINKEYWKDHVMLSPEDRVVLYPFEGDYHNFSFTITYYPQADTAALIAKPNVYDKDELLLGICDNQSENTLNMQRHGRRLLGLIKRTGNDEYYLDVNAKYYSKLLPLMSRIGLPADGAGHTESGYVLYKRDIALYDGFVKCRYYFSKDYNAVQEAAGVRREKHLYDIPLESDECPMIVRKFMVFGFEKGVAEGGYFSDFVASALRSLIGENSGRTYIAYTTEVDGDEVNLMNVSTGKVNYMLFSSACIHQDGTEETLPGNGNVFMLPCLTYGQAKTMNFIARTLDNYSVDYSREGYQFSIWGDAGHLITYNRYVSNEGATAGECTRFRINLAFEYGAIENAALYPNYDETIKKFPVVEDGNFATCMADDIQFDYAKDRTQRPLFCHIIECVPSASCYGKIIIGSAFCRDNNLVRENGQGLQGLRLVVSTSKTIGDDDEWIPDGFTGNYAASDYFSVETETGAAARLEYKGGLSDGITAWAIVNEKGEILLAANGRLRTVYAWLMDFPA